MTANSPEPRLISLSVTDLVEFSARSGDLYPENTGGPSALEGVLAHQRIQRARGSEWQRELSLKYRWQLDDWEIHLQGRLDLLSDTGASVAIEEIKTTLFPPPQLPPGKIALFWAQAQVYAALYHLLHRSESPEYDLRVGLTLVNLRDEQQETLWQPLTPQEAVAETERLLRVYLDWYRQVQERLTLIRIQAKKLAFPFPQYRPGQYELAADIYRVMRQGGALLAEAPTGTGKTLTSLFPACKALGEGLTDQVLYLTGKTTHQQQVENTLVQLREQKFALDCLTLCARDKLCPCRTGTNDVSQPDGTCSYTIGFWDRLPEARNECLRARTLNQTTLTAIGQRHRVCPFALDLHLVPWSTLVVGDYNYFFDPLVRLNAFERGGNKRVLLIDELHNLPERARAMYAAQLSSADMRALANERGAEVKRICRRILRKWKTLANAEQLPELIEQLEELNAAIATETSEIPAQNALLNEVSEKDIGREIYKFCVIYRSYIEDKELSAGHRCVVQNTGNDLRIQLICLDPAPALAQCYSEQKAIIGFSATLTPLPFYRQMAGLPPETHLRQLPYPFPAENLLTLRCDYLDTRWQARERSRNALVDMLLHVVRAKPGKYLVFFPSYEYLTSVYEHFCEQYADIRTVRQNAGSAANEQAEFLRVFFGDAEPALGFAILGGLFAEGVDYTGDALHGAIIVGTAMPQPGAEQNLMADYFTGKGLNPYEYVYQFPGFTRVLQTAGRVIRSERDKGVVILVDPRFNRRDFRNLMPAHWQPKGCRTPEELKNALREFWSQAQST